MKKLFTLVLVMLFWLNLLAQVIISVYITVMLMIIMVMALAALFIWQGAFNKRVYRDQYGNKYEEY